MNYVQPIRDPEQVDQIGEILLEDNFRDYLWWLVGIYAGLRVGDIRKLRVRDVRNKRYLELKEQKTGMARRILIHPVLRAALDEWIKGKRDSELLFKSRSGYNRAITAARIYQILKAAAHKAGVKEAVGTHSMRKTFGYYMYQQERNLGFLREWFGHSSEAITARYIGLTQDLFDKAVRSLKIGGGKR